MKRQIVRLVSGASGHVTFEIEQYVGVQPHRLGILRPSMDNAVADRGELESLCLPQPGSATWVAAGRSATSSGE